MKLKEYFKAVSDFSGLTGIDKKAITEFAESYFEDKIEAKNPENTVKVKRKYKKKKAIAPPKKDVKPVKKKEWIL